MVTFYYKYLFQFLGLVDHIFVISILHFILPFKSEFLSCLFYNVHILNIGVCNVSILLRNPKSHELKSIKIKYNCLIYITGKVGMPPTQH